MKELRIRFDGPPSHVSGRFIECEDETGASVRVGEWRQDDRGEWLLCIPLPIVPTPPVVVTDKP